MSQFIPNFPRFKKTHIETVALELLNSFINIQQQKILILPLTFWDTLNNLCHVLGAIKSLTIYAGYNSCYFLMTKLIYLGPFSLCQLILISDEKKAQDVETV